MTLSELTDVVIERRTHQPASARPATDPLALLVTGLPSHDVDRLTRLLRQRRRRRTELWSVSELLVLLGGIGVGAMIVLAAWIGASGTSRHSTLVGWAAFGVAGPAVAGSAAAVWLLHGLRTLRHDRAEMCTRVRDLSARGTAGRSPRRPVSVLVATLPSSTEYVASPAMTRYHRPDCQMVAGKATVSAASLHAHRSAGRVPCGMCLPSC